ncbi:hypothetical protein GJAV_G00064150 [Gymnothorax javanicus]|nr:hypothetical protein GJAV_G00064150 [Gymnothorax javanicus]
MAAKKRSVVWSFFEEDLDSKNVICRLCAEAIHNCGNTTNMLKHLRSKHERELADATKRRRFDDVTRGPARQRKSKPDLCTDFAENDEEIHMAEMGDERTTQEPLERNEELSDNINGASILSVTKCRKRSPVWRYFQKVSDSNKVLCLVCSGNIHYPQNTSNLLRHLRKKHPGEYSDIEHCLKDRPGERASRMAASRLVECAEHNGVLDNEEVIQVSIITGDSDEQERASNEETDRTVTDIVEQALSLSALPNKKRSAVWNYYECGEDANRVLCLLCSEHIQYRQNTSNLLRHLRKKHPDKNIDKQRKEQLLDEMDGAMEFSPPNESRCAGAPPGLVAPLTLEQAEQIGRNQEQVEQVSRSDREQMAQMRRSLEQEMRALERERELTEQLRRAQQQEARALEQQRELTEQLRRAHEGEMKRLRELEARALEQERKDLEQLRRTQEEEAQTIKRERVELEQMRRELEEERRRLQRQRNAVQQGGIPAAGLQVRDDQSGVEGGALEMLVVTTT